MRMTIELTHFADSPTPPRRRVSVGETLLGPLGFVAVLEQRWGLLGPTVGQALRIGQYVECLRKVDTGKQFYSRSLLTDAWETARALLEWRDTLVLAGWDGDPLLVGSRIETLAHVEKVAQGILASGFSDRLRALLGALQEPYVSLDWLGAIHLIEPLPDWEPWWRKIFTILVGRGVTLSEAPVPDLVAPGDLGQAQALLADRVDSATYSADGSLSLVRADGEGELAEALATWLQTESNENVLVVAEQRSELLDRTLKMAGLPGLGIESPSPNRTLLQVLPGAWETFWDPPSVQAYLHWLGLPDSPVPRRVRRLLSDALADNPGIGGPEWQAALENGRNGYIQWLATNRPATEQKKRVAEWDESTNFWFQHSHYDPHRGIPKEVLMAIVSRVRRWALQRASVGPDPIFQELAGAAGVLEEILTTMGVERVPRAMLNRMWDSVLGTGATRSEAFEEAAPWRLVSHPGAVMDFSEIVVWWRFEDAGPQRVDSPWSHTEMEALHRAGIVLEDASARRRRETRSWSMPIWYAKDRVLLLAARQAEGSETFLHPLWDTLVAGGSKPAMKNATRLFQQGHEIWAGRALQLASSPTRRLAPPQRGWPLASGLIAGRPVESATSIELLFSCSLRWVLQYGLRAQPMDVLRLPHANRMVGVLVHAIVHDMLEVSREWNPEDVEQATLERFDRLVPQLAAPLLEPHQRMVYLATRREIGRAIHTLFSQIRAHQLTVVGSEVTHSREWRNGQRIEGTLDLELSDRAGDPVIWDMKWSKSSHYVKAIEEGNAVQLTTYGWLLNGARPSQAAYVLLRRNPPLVWDSVSHPNAWDRVEHSYDYYIGALQEGATATGFVDPESVRPGEVIARTPDCDFCPYHHLCGIRRSPSTTPA